MHPGKEDGNEDIIVVYKRYLRNREGFFNAVALGLFF